MSSSVPNPTKAATSVLWWHFRTICLVTGAILVITVTHCATLEWLRSAGKPPTYKRKAMATLTVPHSWQEKVQKIEMFWLTLVAMWSSYGGMQWDPVTFVFCETSNYFHMYTCHSSKLLLEPTSMFHKVFPFSDTNKCYFEQGVAYKI